jgi:hypothetical protein
MNMSGLIVLKTSIDMYHAVYGGSLRSFQLLLSIHPQACWKVQVQEQAC